MDYVELETEDTCPGQDTVRVSVSFTLLNLYVE